MNFDLLLEKELAIRTFDYPQDDGTIKHGSTATERILSFGVQPYSGEEKTSNLLHAIDLNTLTPQDIAILTKPEYLEYAWESDNPRERRDRLERVINATEGGNRGHKLLYGSGPAEMRKEKKIDPEGDEYLTDYERPVKTSSYKTYDASKVDGREFIVFDLDPFRKVLNRLHKTDDEYTFENLTDDYLRKASETGEAEPIKPKDILYGEPEDYEEPEFVDERPIEPKEIDEVPKTTEEPEPEIDVKFEPDTDIELGKVDSEFKPEPKISVKERPIEPEPEVVEPELKIKEKPVKEPQKPKELPKPQKIALEPDIEKAIDRRVKREVEKEFEKLEPEKELEPPEPEIETSIDKEIEKSEEPANIEEIEESINRVLSKAGLM